MTSRYPVLHLNADFTPMSVFPLSTLSWQDAVRGIFGKKMYAVAEYDERIPTVDPTNSIRFPSVVVSTRYVPKNLQAAAFNRENIWLRDMGRCSYCGSAVTLRELTFDHVHPRSLGGPTTWTNIVCACQKCNMEKANKTLAQSGKKLGRMPHAPTAFELARNARILGRYGPVCAEWIDFVYWKGSLLQD